MLFSLSPKQLAYFKGQWGEIKAALFLRVKGYSIMERRFKTPLGEIDLLAQKGKTLVAVEVKSRASLDKAAYSITPFQQKRIERALLYYLSGKTAQFNLRFDVILIAPWKFPKHIMGAWLS